MKPEETDSLRQRMLGRTVADVSVTKGEYDEYEILAVTFTDETSVVLATQDTEDYCSWLYPYREGER